MNCKDCKLSGYSDCMIVLAPQDGECRLDEKLVAQAAVDDKTEQNERKAIEE